MDQARSTPRAPLVVGFDASAAAVPRPTGVGAAMLALSRALRDEGPALGVELELLCRVSRGRRGARHLEPPVRAFHERWSLLLARRLDVLHGPDARLPRFRGPALVATLHDLSARRPEFATDRFRRTREAHWAAAAARADLVVTYTEAIRQEVALGLGVPLARIAVVPLAAAALPAPPAARVREVVQRRVGARPYVLVLGERSRRKNTSGALLAFAAAGRALGEHALCVVGPRGRGAEELDSALEGLAPSARERVVCWDYLPADEVACLLAGAAALLFPSRYEGFGLPVLEAFRAGVPVVASRDPSVLEVAGGAALHADAEDVDGLAAALRRALEDPEQRAELTRAGLRRSQDFSWSASARRLAAVYHAAAAGQPAPTSGDAALQPQPGPPHQETA